MNNKILKELLLIAVTLAIMSFDLPKGWYPDGDAPGKYVMEIVKGAGPNGQNAATIKSREKKIIGEFGTLAQSCRAYRYSGKRIKMTADVKSENVADWAGLWLRVDNGCTGEVLSFDNMKDRPIKATTTWKTYEITLDVPKEATTLSYGALLSGTGQIWFTNFEFTVIGNISQEKEKFNSIENEPTNLNFEN